MTPLFFSFLGPSSKSLELQSLSYDSSCTDTSCVNDELEGSSDQYTESGISVNSDETYNNEELDDNSHQNTNDRNHKSKKYKLLKFISKHTLNILYGILGSIVASALTGAIYSIVNITGTGIEMTNKPTNNNLTINSGTRAQYLSMRV